MKVVPPAMVGLPHHFSLQCSDRVNERGFLRYLNNIPDCNAVMHPFHWSCYSMPLLLIEVQEFFCFIFSLAELLKKSKIAILESSEAFQATFCSPALEEIHTDIS